MPEVGDRLPANGADFLHIAHRDDTVDHRQQHDGHNDELEEIDEDRAEGLQVVGGKFGLTDKIEDKSDRNTQDQGKYNLLWQTHFFLFHTTHTRFSKKSPHL